MLVVRPLIENLETKGRGIEQEEYGCLDSSLIYS